MSHQCEATKPTNRGTEFCLRDAHHLGEHRFISDPIPPNIELAELRDENRALRDSLIHACGLQLQRYDSARELWAIRDVANHLATRFTHGRVQEKYEELQASNLREKLDRAEIELAKMRPVYNEALAWRREIIGERTLYDLRLEAAIDSALSSTHQAGTK